jgi:glycine betaine/proline transport system substrate-binding protein
MLCFLVVTAAALSSAPALAEDIRREEPRPVVTVAYVEWSTEIVSSNLVKAVIEEELGVRCRLVSMTAEGMWRAVAEGAVDASVSAWLPDVQRRYADEYGERVVNLGPNLKGTKIGLVVPDVTVGRLTAGTGIRNRPYMTVDSIEELAEHGDELRHRIIGIDPGAGIMHKTREAMEAYGLEDFRLIEGSEVAMVAELSHAIRRQRWIVVTGWLPHWIFARWELKFLEDPKNVFGDRGNINTIVREGLEEEMPEVYRFLDRFEWTPEEMGQLLLWNREDQGLYPYEKAMRWMRTHQDRVESWIE